MTRLKARIMVIVAAALVGALVGDCERDGDGADDPAGHVRHAKKHHKKAASKKKGTKAKKGQKGNAGTTSKGREAERGDDRGRQAEPGDDRGRDAQAEAGYDRGGHGNDDGSGHN